ncbi:hypothetical protein ACXYUI_33725, partial [Klebsiella pneumoniae]
SLMINSWYSGGPGVNFDPQSANGNFYFGKDNALTYFIVSSGNVGIGSATPAYKLDIAGDTRTTGCFKTGAGGT